ncbi:bacterial Ig-like domain-containing protein, partial [Lactococcus lactis]|uniref:bacterial Ig-like domain-containing protein n=1 Tax=Lactococcus lactis TaxID=1358 RepID=UPI000A748021
DNKQSINGSDYSMTLGDKEPTVSDFKASATDKDGNNLDVTADFSKVDFTKAGTYDVVLNTADGQSKTVKLTIKDNK